MPSFSASGIVAIKSTVMDARFQASGTVEISLTVGGQLLASSWYTFPARRIGYDVDGTRVFLVASERLDPDNKGTLHQIPPSAIEGMNGDYSSALLIKGRQYVNRYDAATDTEWVEIFPGFWGEATYAGQNNYVVLFFAEPMRLRAWYSRFSQTWQEDHLNPKKSRASNTDYPLVTLEASPDTTNGQDGKWYQLDYRDANLVTTLITNQNPSLTSAVKTMDGEWIEDTDAYAAYYSTYSPQLLYYNPYREQFLDGRLNEQGWFPLYGGFTRNVVAVRLAISATPKPYPSLNHALLMFHLYGEPDIGAGEVRLAVVDPNTDVELKMDPSWGNVDVGATTVISVGIKNMATTLTATAVTASIASSWPDGSPSEIQLDTDNSGFPDATAAWFVSPLEGYIHLSLDGLTWAKTISLGDLAPLQTVRIYARQMPVTSMELPPNAMYAPKVGVIGTRFVRIQAVTEGWI